MKLQRVQLLLIAIIIISLSSVGCSQTEVQGWSGFAEHDGILYLGSMSGDVLAVNPAVRSQSQSFPGDGEWRFKVAGLGMPAGSFCGPLGCMPTTAAMAFYSTPAVTDDLVYVATYAGDNGKVLAINRLDPGFSEGSPMRSKGEWVYPSETKYIGSVVGNIVIDGDTLFVGSSDGFLYSLDAVYGEKQWEYDTGGKIWTTPVIKDGFVYVGNYERKLCAISKQDGSLLWEIELPAAIASSPVASEESIFFGTFDHNLYAINKEDGSEQWKFSGGAWFWAKPLIQDEVVYACCLDHKVYALDVNKGTELWQFSGNDRLVAPPVFWGDFLVVLSESGELYLLDKQNGALQTSIQIGYDTMAPMHLMGDYVFVHGRDRAVYCVNLEQRELAWKFSYITN